MFCITIKFKNEASVWSLIYQSENAMLDAWKNREADNTHWQLNDDFGQKAVIETASVAGIMFEDLDKSMLAHVERGLHNARTQAHAEKMAMNDPVLKTAAIAKQRGPAIYDPQGNGLGHRMP